MADLFLFILVFDAPQVEGEFEKRQQKLLDLFKKKKFENVELVEQQLCVDVNFLRDKIAEVEKLEGEGLMLRKPRSLYVGNLIKFFFFFSHLI